METNADGGKLDERRTLPARLHEAGYWTALVGKYLNHYPFGRLPYIPAGWDRWVAKRNLVPQTTYANYPLVEGTVPTFVARSEHGYATDLLADRAVDVLAQAPTDRPWFVLFAPSAPHAPWTPPRRYAHVFDDVRLRGPSEHVLNDVRGKPRWIRNRRPIDSARRRQLLAQRGREREALLGLDDAVRRVVAAVAARGELDDTVILYLTDNGYAFGEHRWQGKRCPYEPCIDTPFAIRAPGLIGFESSDLVSNLDVAPTIAELAGVDLGKVDGISLAPLLEDQRVKVRPGVPIGYAGDVGVPPWRGFRTPGLAYIENADGTVELYDLAGALGPPDPDQLDNRATDPAYADARQSLARFLDRWGPPARTPR